MLAIIVYDGKSLCYIPSCDEPANVYLDGLVGSAHGWKAEGSGFDPGPGKKKKKAFSLLLLLLYIKSKDGCEKGHGTPKVLDINALVGVQEFT